MQTTHENNPNSAMLREVAQAKEEAQASARGDTPAEQELTEETPAHAQGEAAPEPTEEAAPETPAAPEGDSGDEPIRINGRTFPNQAEAFAYAEEIAREKELTDAHAAGIREALEATRTPVAPPPEEDDFEQRFYANPKETLKGLKEEAKREALQVIQQEQQRERLWNDFLSAHPDIRRKDAERVLQENWDTIGKMTDLGKAQKVLATKVRAEYEEIANLMKPRTELSSKKQVVSASGNAPARGVTPKKEERPLDFASQMKAAFKR